MLIYCKGNFSGTRRAGKQSNLAQVSLTLSEWGLCCICKSDLGSKRSFRALKGSKCMGVLLTLHHSHSPRLTGHNLAPTTALYLQSCSISLCMRGDRDMPVLFKVSAFIPVWPLCQARTGTFET